MTQKTASVPQSGSPDRRPDAATGARPSSYFGGLDGLRAIAVGLVLVYHLFPGIVPGGFLGVDVFFVISGFLITSLLLREWERHGRIRLWDFWRRRARRLLPALGVVLLVCTSLALLIGGDPLVGIGRQLLGAATFSSNWLFIIDGADYFAHDTPELFRNVWSLAIEEQFYLLLPLLAILLLRFGPRARWLRVAVFGVLGVASASLMWRLVGPEMDATRIYFGSDAHSFGLLFGAALAAAVPLNRRPVPGPARQATLFLTALAGLGTLLVLAFTLAEGSPASFQGGFQLATGAALVLVWAVTRPGALAGRLLDWAPLRWVGHRSYGIYLWHWPLLVLAQAAAAPWSRTPAGAWILGGIVLLATLGVAELSYRFLEQPVRRHGLITSLRLLLRPVRDSARQRVTALGVTALLLVTVPASIAAIVAEPAQSTAAASIDRGAASLAEDANAAGPASAAQAAPEPLFEATPATVLDPVIFPGRFRSSGAVLPAPTGESITAVGDSVMLASSPELQAALPGIDIDAEVSRSMTAGIGVLDGIREFSGLRPVLLIGLGTNGPVDRSELDELMLRAEGRPVVLVNAYADREWIPGVNQELSDFAAARRGVVVADWRRTAEAHPELLAGDGIHPEPAGGEAYAAAVAEALTELRTPAEAVGFERPRR